MRIDLQDLEASFCTSCAGYGVIPEGDDDHVRYERCDDCGGSGLLQSILRAVA